MGEGEFAEVSLVAFDASNEYEGQQQAEDARGGHKRHPQALQGAAPVPDNGLAIAP